MIKLLGFRVQTSNGKGMIIDKAYFVSEIASFIHNWQRFPLASFDVDLLNIWRKSDAEYPAKHNHLVRLWTEARAV